MSEDPAAGEAAGASQVELTGAEPASCWPALPGLERAAKVRRKLNERIEQGGDAILDQVILKVNAKHKAQVHDPRRTLAGTLTPALTWGIFGLLAGGLKSLALWAVRRCDLRRTLRLLLRAPAHQG